MANQPTKYRKFVVGAASAALVASAVAPVASAASFTDVSEGNSHKASIDALVAKGVISGYPDGTFKPTQTLKRSDVVKMMGKWLKSEGYTAAADYKTNPRFADLTSSSNEELLEMAALVKDNGLFVGTPDGKLDPNGNITRENMAIVIVRAFDRVHDIDLATYVAGQEFKKDVVDLGKAKAEARPAIEVLDYFDITNPAAPSFNPKDTTNRAQFASFLNKAIETDYSEVGSGVVGDATVKAVNATTVEVTFKDAVENINSLNFTIEGLTVSNAAVKQTDNKTVVLTTAVQEGGKEYTVALNNDKIGTFKGVSAVVPTKITVNTTSLQQKVGQQAILSADVGVKQAGIPVTFNVAASGTLNKDQIFEVVTNADGIATFSYTQYAADVDSVSAYATGAPAVRDFAKVYWGVDNILTIEADDKKGNEVNNGENKVYKVTYKDPKTGKPVANARLNVTFAENVDTEINKITKATVNGKTPYQLNNGNDSVVTVNTNSKGEATLTVSGSNTKATPVVFVDDAVNNRVAGNDRLEATELQAKADQLVIGAVQSSYDIAVTRDGGQEAATGLANGRTYKVAVTKKDGKPAANETVNVSFDEILDRNMNTKTSAVFVKNGTKNTDATNAYQQLSIKLNAKGEGSFTIATDKDNVNDYATPVVWIDINSSDAKYGNLDEGEPSKVADITYFAKPELTGGTVKAYDARINGNEVDEDENFDGDKPAYFKFTAANQSGKKMGLPDGYSHIEATFTVWNTGAHDITVDGKTVSPDRSITVTKSAEEPTIEVRSVNDKTTSVRVEARGTAEPTSTRYNRLQSINLGSHETKASFVSTKDVGVIHTGLVTAIDTKDQKITFEDKDPVSYKDATFKNISGNTIDRNVFEKHISDRLAKGETSRVTISKDGDKLTVSIIEDIDVADTPEVIQNQVAVSNALKEAEEALPTTALSTGATITVPTLVDGATITWSADSNLITGDALTRAVAEETKTLTVGTVETATTVTLTAVSSKGEGNNKVEKTQEFKLELSPKEVDNVTRGQLNTLIEEAEAKIDGDKENAYTKASVDALKAAIAEAKAVVNVTTPAQAEMNKVAADLDKAVKALKDKASAEAPTVTAKAEGNKVTLSFSEAVNVDAGNITISEKTGTIAKVDAAKTVVIDFTDMPTVTGDADITVELPATENTKGETFTYTLTYTAVDGETPASWTVKLAETPAP